MHPLACELLPVLTYDRRQRSGRKGGADHPGQRATYVKTLRDRLGDDAARPAYILTERRVWIPHVRAGERRRAAAPPFDRSRYRAASPYIDWTDCLAMEDTDAR